MFVQENAFESVICEMAAILTCHQYGIYCVGMADTSLFNPSHKHALAIEEYRQTSNINRTKSQT